MPGPGMAARTLVALLALAPIASGAQIYRWVDDEGRTSFSDTPPPGKIKGQKVTKGETAPAAPATKGATNGKSSEAAPKPAAQQSVQADPALCAQAQQSLQLLESNRPLAMAGANGQPVEMDASARAREILRLRSILQTCN